MAKRKVTMEDSDLELEASSAQPQRQLTAQPIGPRVGGSFAPSLSDELMEKYKGMIDGLEPSPVKDHMQTLWSCCNEWWGLPEPEGTEMRAHPSGLGTMVSLQADHKETLDELIPWARELEIAGQYFNELPTGTTEVRDKNGVIHSIVTDQAAYDLRNASFHLLWHVKELDLGREPITKDKLGL